MAKKQVILCRRYSFEAPAVLVATGTKERLMSIPGEERNIGRGISYCAVCDGAFYRDKEIAVIGAGNSALEEAVYLTQFANKVYIIMRRNVFRADKIAVDAATSNPKIEIIQQAVPIEVLDDTTQVTGLKISDVLTKEERILNISGIFPYISAEPVTDFLKPLNVLDEHGYILVNDTMETKVPSFVMVSGDVRQKHLTTGCNRSK